MSCFIRILLTVVCVLAFGPSVVDSQDTGPPSPPIHPYFDNALSTERPAASARKVLVDDHVLPVRVSFSCNQLGFDDDTLEARSITFVLVMPQSLSVDGQKLSVDRPYYIATTELSNEQYARLHKTADGVFPDYATWANHVYVDARLDIAVPGHSLDGLAEHLSRPDHPALRMDLESASIAADGLSILNEVVVRLPTMAEWFAAMRAGGDAQYWWGDDVMGENMAWRGNDPSRSDWSHLRRVDAGPENSLGLFNCLGNASELVYPTRVERRQLRKLFGPQAADAADPIHLSGGYSVREHSTFALGGSVDTGWQVSKFNDSKEQWRTGFTHQTSQLAEIVLWHQFSDNPAWAYTSHWCAGARFVIEIPLGDFEVVGAASPIS